ncbi:hypothetical protein [Algoriphagus persicinus]|uniref:hypothetical protein n=1 Tax=Algoriphagus persicinus TaxID=3108754 RepID=UPI002B38C93F|nr:hypothetical protein [Algoriphagus sp. E1-3-M2]MEB2785546.1 hypothetical protein [Algoriphagus sp. E1-3-M2]
MAKFENGNPGRPKGAKNKSTIQIREKIQALFDDNFETIQGDLESLEAKDRLKFMTDLMPYLMPKLQSTSYNTEIDLDGMTDEQLDVLIKRIINE